MIIKRLSRYPIKGLNEEPLNRAHLEVGAGIVGDRRFAFGIDETVDDGVWRSSRSYLINAINDNLLKFNLTADGNEWRLRNPAGDHVYLSPDEPSSLEAINATIRSFVRDVPNCETPRLIDRKTGEGPKGHWDFPDSELLIINLATIRELEQRWGFDIDPRRFRYNILVDGIPAWSEFGLYGCRFSIGAAQVDILRPARRCAATAVNPDTGDRDADILKRLIADYGHGFFGVYAKVLQAGEIAIGDECHWRRSGAISPDEVVCDIAPGIAHWPKAAIVANVSPHSLQLTPVGAWPLISETETGNIKIHHGNGLPIVAEIQSTSDGSVTVTLNANETSIEWINDRVESCDPVLISGPYALRSER